MLVGAVGLELPGTGTDCPAMNSTTRLRNVKKCLPCITIRSKQHIFHLLRYSNVIQEDVSLIAKHFVVLQWLSRLGRCTSYAHVNLILEWVSSAKGLEGGGLENRWPN